MNGIIIDGKIYEAEIGFDPNQCTHCDLSKICDEYFSDPEDTYPCKLLSLPATRLTSNSPNP